MSPLYKAPSEHGHHTVFKPGQDGIEWLGLDMLRLKAGERWQGSFGQVETAFVILGGRCHLTLAGPQPNTWHNLGGRADVFSGAGTTVYLPPKAEIEVEAVSGLEVALASSPCDVELPPVVIGPDDVKVISAGASNWRRDVRLMIPPGSPISQRMIVGETLNPPGNWSGVPPHKHDLNSDIENFLEEFYLFKARPGDGYGVQLMYHDDQGEGLLVGDNRVSVMLKGYHPTVAAPGVTLCYLWVLAGEMKDYDITIDPRFGWVAQTESVLRENRNG